LADPALSEVWMDRCRSRGLQCLLTDCTEGRGVRRIPEAVASLCADRLERYAGKGMTGRKLRVMVLGIPNVGKSTLINRLAGSSKARTEDRPGVTRELQWIPAADGLYLLDSPGVLWPRISDRTCAENLAITGAIKDAVLDTDEISLILISRLRRYYPSLLAARYRLTEQEVGGELTDAEVYELIARKRGFILRGGEISYDRTSAMLLDEFRGGTVGRITLDRPAGGRTGEADPEDA
jgi:ribosome biogenesis GTPase A